MRQRIGQFKIFELVVDSVSYELIGDVPFGLWPDSSVRQLVGRGLLEGRGVSWLLQKQGLDLFSAPFRDCQLGGLRSRRKTAIKVRDSFSHSFCEGSIFPAEFF